MERGEVKREIALRMARSGAVFDVRDRCLICGRSFWSTECLHSVDDNETVVKEYRMNVLLGMPNGDEEPERKEA